MKLGGHRIFRRFIFLATVGILAAVLTACTGKGGGYLPPGPYVSDPAIDQAVIEKFVKTSFTGQAPFGFTFSCEDKGGLNPPTGKLAIELAYSDQGTSALNAPFGIHGIVDKIDPLLESMFCSGQTTPPEPLPPNELIFLGRYRSTSSSKPGALKDCPTRETTTSPLCRFEVFVRDNDKNMRPSKGDFFSIQLSTATCTSPTDLSCSTLPIEKVFYARAGYLAGGNLTVK
jgi:predicted small lipoprotein YifL